jgi:hypothetical protein
MVLWSKNRPSRGLRPEKDRDPLLVAPITRQIREKLMITKRLPDIPNSTGAHQPKSAVESQGGKIVGIGQ